MKDFAKSIITNNKKVGNKDLFNNGEFAIQDDGKVYFKESSIYGNISDVKSQVSSKAKELRQSADKLEKLYNQANQELKKLGLKTGNKKVGNREISLSASNSGELNLYDDGTGFMYDPIELGRYDINGKSDAMATVRELEKLKREAEAKVRDCQKFIDTLKQWANGLK